MLRYWSAVVLVACAALPARAGLTATYTEIASGTAIDLTAAGNIDWVKWGNSTTSVLSFTTVEKVGGTIINPTLTPLGTAPPGFTVQLGSFAEPKNMNFSWTDGTAGMAGGGPVDTIVTEYLSPGAFSYPIGIGASFTANASATARVMDVYVQGFNADMRLTATLSGGLSVSTVVTPSQNPGRDPGNDYAVGRYRITFDGVGELLTVSVRTLDPRTDGAQAQFANAGFFAASIGEATAVVPEPGTVTLLLAGAGVLAVRAVRRQRR